MEQYGSGISNLSSMSGVPAETIEKALKARKERYKKTYELDKEVLLDVQGSRVSTKIRTPKGYSAGFGYYRSCTGTSYGFLETDSPDWQAARGEVTCFPIPIIKNYPSQGLGGEITQVQVGRLYRMLLDLDLTDKIKLINTVHDSVYLDIHKSCINLLPMISGLLENVSPYFNLNYGTAWNIPFKVSCEYGNNMLELTEEVTERSDLWIGIF